MQGPQKGVIKRIRQLSIIWREIHCIFHRETLVTKKLKLNVVGVGGQQNELKNVPWKVVDIVH